MPPSAYEYLRQEDDALLAQCRQDIYKASGPGGQHRNKVSSAVRLRHEPTDISATANDSRSQHDNRRLAIKRLRMNLAVRLRGPAPGVDLPEIVRDCIHHRKGAPADGSKVLTLGRKDHRFWTVAAVVLDILQAHEGALSDSADHLGISTGSLTRFLKSDRHLWAATQDLRRQHNLKPLH
jgi:hypothetical protein